MTPKTAGRELDAEVAEKVMGWKRGVLYGNGNGEWIEPGQEKLRPKRTWHATPKFSSDISSAWEVVEKLTKMSHLPDGRGCGLVVKVGTEDGPEPFWVEVFDSSPMGYANPEGTSDEPLEYFCVHGRSAPHAICLASLIVMQVLTKEQLEDVG